MSRGFTLIELMIVVSIMGILASVAIPAYEDYTGRAQLAEALSITEEIKASVGRYHDSHGTFPADNHAAGVPRPDKLLGNHVAGIRVRDGAIHVRLGQKITAQLDGRILTLRPIVVPGSPESPMSWLCGNSPVPDGMRAVGTNRTDVPDRMLPNSCR